MKRILLALLILPQIVFAQYSGDVFTLNSRTIPIEQRSLGLNIQKDTIINLGVRGDIYGLSVTGTALLENNSDSYVRVILRDDHNYEYLVYECFPLLTETLTPQFQNTALETKSLDGITPQSLRIELLNASINFDSFGYVPESESAKGAVVNSAILQKEQVRHIADMMNDNLVRRDMTWRAGVTSIAEKSFEEKKAMFGGRMPQLYGFDYYVGGIFIMPSSEVTNPRAVTDNDSLYVSQWDWRDRHGRNWMTGTKYQGICHSCYAFATVGALEAYTNLYYNRIIPDNDLSEQEIVSCSDNNGCISGSVNKSMLYIKQNGIVNEGCFTYNDTIRACTLKCTDPDERIGIQDYSSFSIDSIKKEVIRHPVTFGIKKWFHIMTLCGYKNLAYGDTVYFGDTASIVNGNTHVYKTTISENHFSELAGRTAWLLKNSWGTNWGASNNGYCYIITDDMTNNLYNLYSFRGGITSLQYDDSDIVCEDRDGDGLYNWGLGERPSFCPTWIPYDEDGDDNNHLKGILYLDNLHVIGELETINPNGIQTLTISSNTTYTTRQYMRKHIVVPSNKTLTVKNILNMFGRPTITIQSGGQLIVDGGVITNANISLSAGAKLVLKNGGKIVIRTNTSFNAPIGALVDIAHGEIIRSNDF